MWFKLFALLLAGLFVVPVFAHEDGAHTVSFDAFSFSYDIALGSNVNIWHYAGDPVEGAAPGFTDAASTTFNLYDAAPAPESLLDGRGGLRLYAVSDLAQYDFMQVVVDQLQSLVTDQPDLAAYESTSDSSSALPYLPVPTHGQMIKAHAEYVETEQVRGISYIVNSPTMAAAEYFVSSSFWFVFQGISTDGQYYVSAVFPLTTTVFPEIPPNADLPANWDAYVAQSTTNLNEAPAADFTPSLDQYYQLIESISFAG